MKDEIRENTNQVDVQAKIADLIRDWEGLIESLLRSDYTAGVKMCLKMLKKEFPDVHTSSSGDAPRPA